MRTRTDPQSDVEAEPDGVAVAEPGALQERVLVLQRTAGNAAVGRLLARQTATAPAPKEASGVAEWRKLLQEGDESGAIAHAGRMTSDECTWALGKEDLRSLAVKTFDDEEMAHAMYAMKGGTLVQKLNWMSVEGSSWK